MRMEERTGMKLWVEAWKKAGPALERIHEEEIRRTDTVQAVLALSGGMEGGLPVLPARSTSGLVEQQAFFRKLHLTPNT